MIGGKLFEVTIPGNISTNSNRENIYEWRGTLERFLSTIPNSSLQTRRIAIKIKFWVQELRLNRHGNDLDNLTKPILDALKRSGIIYDDDQIYHLGVTKFPTKCKEEIHLVVKDWN